MADPVGESEGQAEKPHLSSKEMGQQETIAYPSTDGMVPPLLDALSSVDQDEFNYEIGAKLGAGGMAIVYEAIDVNLGRTVALKAMREALAENPEERQRFFQEARVLAQMDHPHVLPVYSVGEREDLGPFYTMKKIQGETFRDVLRRTLRHGRRSNRNLAAVMETFEQVCQAVAYAHRQGVVHRDLKPDNVMVDDYGEALVLDWGMAKSVGDSHIRMDTPMTQSGIIKGTPVYMSPEQADGKPVDLRTDVFSLGIMLYEILSGKLPFAGQSITEILDEVITREPPSPRQMAGCCVDRVLSAICMKALAKDRERRYPSAVELCEDIHLWRSQLPTSAYSPNLRERAVAWAKRNQVVAASLATGLLVLMAVGLHRLHRMEMARTLAAEEKRQTELQQQREETEHKRQVATAIEKIKELFRRIDSYDVQISALEDAATHIPKGENPERMRVEAKLAELRTARDAVIDSARMSASMLVSAVLSRSEKGFGDLPLNIVTFIRELVLQQIDSHIRNGQLYQAHYQLWHWSLEDNAIKFTAEQQALMKEKRKAVEASLLQERGAAGLPDWRSHQTRAVLIHSKR